MNKKIKKERAKEKKKSCSNCRCQNSKCLKLYCDCLRSGNYCEGCDCVDCENRPGNHKREKIVMSLK